MGQTLTHGVYLPDEGERNCYSGLAANWQILDTSVGTIAEHTSQIAGKAPLVHTHTKADITDLFNSANVWSALNSYSNGQIRIKSQSQEKGVIPSSSVIQYLEFADKNDAQHGIVGLWDYANGASEIQMYITDKFKNGTKDPTGTSETTILSFGFKTDGSKFLTFSGQVDNSVIPKSNNTYDLGSSSYQWNNLYAKNYYYNGVVWGLDKANEWTGLNTFSSASNCVFSFKFGSSGSYNDIRYYDSNDSNYACLRSKVNELTLGLKYSSASAWYNGASVTINNTGAVQIKSYDGTETWTVNFAPVGVYPTSDKALELGTSTHKWKTFNGENPGALSLPNIRSGMQIDITNWNSRAPNGEIGAFTAPVDCIVSIQMTRNVDWGVWVINGNFRQTFRSADNSGNHLLFLIFPVAKGESIGIYCPVISSDETPITFVPNKQLYFPCLGNV